MRRIRQLAPLVLALAFAGGAGFLASTALGIGSQAPTSTTTITIPTGQQGPPGPPGSPGAESCPTGSTFKALEIDHPGGHVTIYTCIAD